MKILHVNHLLDPVSGGGTAERTYQLARFLAGEVEESVILTLDIGDITASEIPTIPARTALFFMREAPMLRAAKKRVAAAKKIAAKKPLSQIKERSEKKNVDMNTADFRSE